MRLMRMQSALAIFAVALLASAAPGDSSLVEAARNHDQQKLRDLLSRRPDANVRSSDGSTALLWATHWNDLAMTELLLRAGANPNAANDFRMTPLWQACTNANAALVQLLLKSGANPNTPIATGATPLMTCAKAGSIDAVRALIARDADVNTTEPLEHQTALMWAAEERHPDAVKALIDAHADLYARTRKGFTVLHFAARQGDAEMVRILLAAGMDVNLRTQPENAAPASREKPTAKTAGDTGVAASVRSGNGKAPSGALTPLLIATIRGKVDFALFLLDHGADPNINDAGLTPLHWASATWENGASNPIYGFEDPMSGIPDRQEKLKLVKALLAHGADANVRMKRRPPVGGGYTDVNGATPFLLASSADDIEMMKILLAAGADPKPVTATKTTAIMAAAGLNRLAGDTTLTEAQALAAVKFLLDLGLDAKGSTTFGENALFGPAYRGWNKLLSQLINLGVNVNAENRAGITPWLAASGQGDRLGGVLYNKDGADLLLKHGADPNLGRPCMAQTKCKPIADAKQ
jgi:ankyrin repeat protein